MKNKVLFLKAVAYDSLNKCIKEYLESYVSDNTEITVRSLKKGPKHLEYEFYQALAAEEMIRESKRAEKEGYNAVVISCFDDLHLYALREISKNMIVTAPAESSMLLAAGLGDGFSIIVPNKKCIPQMRYNALKYGVAEKLKSFRSLDIDVLNIHENEDDTVNLLRNAVNACINDDGAEVIILGCSMQFGYFKLLQQEFGIPIIDSMIAPVKYAEYLLELKEKTGWDMSRIGLYKRPDEDEIKQWKLEEDFNMNGLLIQ